MAKITVYPSVGKVLVTSAFTGKQIKKVAKYRPKALLLIDEETKKPCFAVAPSLGDGNISAFGASLCASDEDAPAKIVFDIPEGAKDPFAFAEETIGGAIINLNAVENNISEALLSIEDELQTVRSNISVVE